LGPDIIGQSLYAFVAIFTALPFCSVLALQNTPLYALMTDTALGNTTVHSSGWTEAAILGTNAIVCLLTGFEASRAACGIAAGLMIALLMFRNGILKLYQVNRWQLTKCYSLYTKLMIIKILAQKGQALLTFTLVGVLMICSVCCNYAAIMMYGVIPMPYYLLFPFASLIVVLWVGLTLPQAIECDRGSQNLLRLWGKAFRRRSYHFKKIRSMRRITFYGGVGEYNLFALRRSIKAELFWCVSGFTITAILS